MDKVYEVWVRYYEGEPSCLGTFRSKEMAQACLDVEKADWGHGPNVEVMEIVEREVQ